MAHAMNHPHQQDIRHAPVSTHQRGSSFPVRRMDFEFDGLQRYFVNGDPASSFFLTSFQAFFPEGEQFFVDSVRDAQPLVSDERLLKEISAFIGQESMHGKEHKTANEELRRQGINVFGLDAKARWTRKKLNKILSLKMRLAGTAAVEHYTAVLAEYIMKTKEFENLIQDPKVKSLIYWHAMEESEHRAVAFDVYKHVGGGYILRAVAMAIVSALILPVIMSGMYSIMKQDGQLTNWKSWGRFAKTYFGRRGIITALVPDLLLYFKPSFHPMDSDMDSVMVEWKERLGLNPSAS